jgi:hypothetical protein
MERPLFAEDLDALGTIANLLSTQAAKLLEHSGVRVAQRPKKRKDVLSCLLTLYGEEEAAVRGNEVEKLTVSSRRLPREL